MKKLVGYRLPIELVQKIRYAAFKQGIAMSDLVEKACRMFLDNKGKRK